MGIPVAPNGKSDRSAMMEFLAKLFDTSDFPARWYCGSWSSEHGWLHIVSDLAIFGAYMAIPIALLIVARRHTTVGFHRLALLFAAFIFACGTTHFLEALIFWHPVYRFAGVMKLVTAIVSWATVVAIVRLAPHAFELRGLVSINNELRLQIQEREAAEAKLRASEATSELARSLASVGVLRCDYDQDVITLDEIAASIFDLPAEEPLPRSEVHGRIVNEDWAKVEPMIAQAIADGRRRLSLEHRVLDRQGRTRWLLVEKAFEVESTSTGGSRVRSAVVAVVDRTKQRNQEEALQEALRQAEAANAARGAFLANMSHEIRTPMAAILGHTDILLRHLDDPDNRQCATTIKRSGKHLIGILNDILDLSKIEAGKLSVQHEPTDLSSVLSEVAALMKVRVGDKPVEFQVLADTELPHPLMTDAKRLRQVLINLVGNALKFTEEGHVRLRASLDKVSRELCLSIEDTGIGIASSMTESLFESFVQADDSRTRRFEGSGLGLTISKRLVESMGGVIEFESTEGVGSTFRVVLPVGDQPFDLVPYDPDPEEADTNESRAAGRALSGSSRELPCRVLLVDDRRDIRHVGQHFIEDAGAVVTTAVNGREALEAVRAAADAGRPFDVIVMDIQMPVMDGYEATGELRRLGEDVPIVALTADAMKEDQERCYRAGCDGYLSKPIDPDELIEVLIYLTSEVSRDELRQKRVERQG